jgi:hypothetical protein
MDDRIVVDPKICSGKPAIRDTRIVKVSRFLATPSRLPRHDGRLGWLNRLVM